MEITKELLIELYKKGNFRATRTHVEIQERSRKEENGTINETYIALSHFSFRNLIRFILTKEDIEDIRKFLIDEFALKLEIDNFGMNESGRAPQTTATDTSKDL